MATAREQVPGAQACLRQRLGREPTVAEVAGELGFCRSYVHHLYVELGLHPGRRSTSRDKLPEARRSLIQQLGREPTLAEVGRAIGCSRERVRQIYGELGLDTRKGRLQKGEARRRSSAERTKMYVQKNAVRAQRRARVVQYAKENPKATQREIGQLFGMRQGEVSKVCRAAGIDRLYRFDEEEDQVLEETGNTQAARLLNRDPVTIAARRRVLQRGRRRLYPLSEDERDEILTAFDRTRSWTKAARELGVSADVVREVVRRSRGRWYKCDCLKGSSDD